MIEPAKIKIAKIFSRGFFLLGFFIAVSFFARPVFIFSESVNIAKINFTTNPQTINAGEASPVLTIQTQNTTGTEEKVSESGTHLILNSSSSTGQFSDANSSSCNDSTWESQPVTLTIRSGSANKNFCYKDTTSGMHTLTVTAQDKDWSPAIQNIIINSPKSFEKSITSFNLLAEEAIIDENAHKIDVTVPFGTDVSVLHPEIIISDKATISPDSGIDQNFTNPVIYTVTAEDGSTVQYTVTVLVAISPNLDILSETVSNAKNKYDNAEEGKLPGQYPPHLKEELFIAISKALEVGSTSPQTVIDDAVVALGQAVKVFEEGVVPDTTPPVIILRGLPDMNIYEGSNYSDAGAFATDNFDGDITKNIFTVNHLNSSTTVGTYMIIYDVSDSSGNQADQVVRTVKVLPVSTSAQLLSDSTLASSSAPEILVGANNDRDSVITIPDDVTNVTINILALTTSANASTSAIIPAAILINASTTAGIINVAIPANTEIKANVPDWNGVINAPQIKQNSSVSVLADDGEIADKVFVIEIGYGDTKLVFNKAIRIVFRNQAGKDAGYSREGVFKKINKICLSDDQDTGDSLPDGEDCKINVGADLIIWTKHFTNFVTYSQTAIPPAVKTNNVAGGNGPPIALSSGTGELHLVAISETGSKENFTPDQTKEAPEQVIDNSVKAQNEVFSSASGLEAESVESQSSPDNVIIKDDAARLKETAQIGDETQTAAVGNTGGRAGQISGWLILLVISTFSIISFGLYWKYKK